MTGLCLSVIPVPCNTVMHENNVTVCIHVDSVVFWHLLHKKLMQCFVQTGSVWNTTASFKSQNKENQREL